MLVLAREAMRSRFEIVLADDDDPARLRAAAEEALDEIDRVEASLSAYRPDSDLFGVNRLAGNGPVAVPPLFLRFLTRAAELSDATDGAFDPTVGPLLDAWGLSGDGGSIPGDDALAAARDCVGLRENVRLDPENDTVAFVRPGVRLDPGAIGKGWALERAAELLRDAGIRRALLHGGTSTVCALGDGWKIAIQDPRDPNAHLATLTLDDGRALSVSGVHGKSFWARGRRFGHVIDPRSGQPVEHTLLAAVVADSATATDALSTGLLVLGGDAGLPILGERFPDADLLTLGDDGRVRTLFRRQ